MMFGKTRRPPVPAPAPDSEFVPPHAPPSELLREDAARMLMGASVVAGLDVHEARLVIDAMDPIVAPAGTVLMEEGQTDDADYMALLLDGQVRAETLSGLPGEDVVISILEPGQLIGEMGLLDGSPRSATCTALTDVVLATLTRDALRDLVEAQPALAARLLLAVSQSMAARLRESNRRLLRLSQVTRALQLELDATHAVNRRLLAARDAAA